MELTGLNPSALHAETALETRQGRRLQALAAGLESAPETREGLEKAAQQFESVFLNQLLKAMRSTVPENEFFNSGGPTKYYQQMYDAEMAKALSDGNSGMGIARLIVQQFEQNVDPEAEATGPVERTVPRPDLPLPRAIESYGRQDVSGSEGGRMLRLRRLAENRNDAAADTLRRFEAPIVAASRDTGLDPGLVLAVMMEESGGNPQALSPRGAEGLMQLMPATAEELGVTNRTDPMQNVRGGARYLKNMLERYSGDLDLALAAYNAGPGNVEKAGGQVPAFRETRNYVERVKARYQDLGGGTELADPGR